MKTRFEGNALGAASKPWVLTLIFICCTLPLPASAGLGGDAASVQADQQYMNASQKITVNTAAYTVYELQTATGTVVREYVSSSDTVFAIVWQGPSLPDLRQVLGSYFTQYTEAAQTQHADHGHLVVQQPELMVESSGRMRAFWGRAYLPGFLPQGVVVSEIQ